MNTTLKIPEGNLIFKDKNLVISDNQAISLSRVMLSLLSIVMLAVLVKGFEFLNFSSWLVVASMFAWLFPVWLLYSLRNASDATIIEYDLIKEVKYKKTHFGFRKPTLEVQFNNKSQSLKKRYIHINQEQVKPFLIELKCRGVYVKV